MPIQTEMVYPKESRPYGLTFNQWTVKWWKWLLSIPKSMNPSIDLNGENALISQPDRRVFFLCQSIEGTIEKPTRKLSIPKGKSIFMPILNWISTFYEDGNSKLELVETAAERINAIENLQVKIGGKNIQGLKEYRFKSKFFEVNLPTINILGLPSGKSLFFSDGYWLFTKRIFNDTEISTFASCSSGLTKIGVNYSIKVY